MLKNFTFLFCILSIGFMTAQNKDFEYSQNYKSSVNDPSANFFEIVAQKRAEIATWDLRVKANHKAMKQFERWVYIWQDKVNADGSFPTMANRPLSGTAYINALMADQNQNRGPGDTWEQIGPVDKPLENGYVGYPGKGRINVIAEDPTNTDIMYAGSAAGGIWKTTNGGLLWTPKSDFLAGLGVTDILVDPNNTNIIYMATGDEDGQHISSIGVFKSTDAGETWNPTGLTFSLDENEFINDLAFAPGSSTKIFALTNTEIKVTTNSGTTWTDVPVTYPYGTFTEGFQNIVFDPNDATKVVVSDRFDAIYFSTDSGANFAMHAIFEGGNSQKKLKITSSPNDPDYFYGVSEEERSSGVITKQAEFRKYKFNLANTAADLVSSTDMTGFNSQGGYNQNIAVSPVNKNHIIVAGVNGFRSTDGGATFTTLMNAYDTPPGVGFYVHADHHHVSFVGNTENVLNGHDGGIHKGPFNATTATPWEDISNTLVITQPYNIAVTQEASGDNFMMANQDNDGFSKILQGGSRNWLSAIAGDGTATAIDISNSDIRYLGGTNGQLYRADAGYADGYDQATYILGNNNDAAFVSPMAVHPTNANIIYACHGDIKKSVNKGGTGDPSDWTALSTGLTRTKFIDVTANGGSIRIYTISETGVAKRSDDDGATWTTVTPPAGQVFNSFSAIPNATIVYATVNGYNAGNKVYKSTDSGATWTNISAGLPNIIMKKVVANRASTDETLYLGTELGPYFRNNTANWQKMGTGLPNVRVEDLEINYTDNILYIGTFGRGMWKMSTIQTDSTPPVPDVPVLPDVISQCAINSIAELTIPTATDAVSGTINGTTTATFPITANTTITWTYTDTANNSSTQTQDIIINDTTAPVPDVVNLPDAIEQCSVTSLPVPTATDNCVGSVTGTTTTTFPITASTTVVWTYTDGANTSTQNQTVTINDTTAPVPDVTTLPDVVEQCSVTSLPAPTATDACAGSVTGTTTTTFPITASTTVVWTYTDGANTSTQNQTVTINDTTAPVPDVTTLPDVVEQCSVTSLPAPTATDACAGSVTGTTTTTFPITASTTVVWTYTDGANTSTQNQTVIINDTTAPVPDVTTLPDVVEQCSVTSLPAPTATDACAGSVTGTTTTTFPITASTTVVWNYTDGANTSTQNQTVTINDTTAPVPDATTLPDVIEECSVASLPAPTATDNCVGGVIGTTTTTFPITASTTVVWTYTDGANTSTQSQTVTINDTTAPVPNIPNLPTITATCSVDSIPAPIATDNCIGSVTATTTATFPILESTVITWSYTDGTNVSIQNQIIVIEPIDNSVTQTSNTLTANASGYNYQWVDCDNGNAPISGETNQSFTPTVSGNYAVVISNALCTVTSNCYMVTVLGIPETSFGTNLKVYPNPVKRSVTVELGSFHKNVSVSIYNLLGQIVAKQDFNDTNKIEMEIEAAAAIYFMNLTSETGQTVMLRLIKE
ncbi:T9SS type A sorting domain-containing protein [Aequorivita marisscotiae]|uniref:T9SS type A sorting domain-containing protein n=1 Tax=Aequorivita marisscotiae TaxID=3040348 RepID=A0ABY8KYQ5_9FLAO|nr:T9SS type A sorting domain-containing protein [Aequorivita sp. Ant34-E75]WGF92961.1 T9SS type A sorting domain-containing protein [Aequorivita sp. Ant34-E75]